MREILFRGKDFSGVLSHSWIFGSLDTTEKEYPSIIYLDRFGNRCRIFVNPKTVGQYTGLTDKNGKKIFENDIVKIKGKTRYIFYGSSGFRHTNYGEYADTLEKVFTVVDCEVIGNIYDNPELLEVKE